MNTPLRLLIGGSPCTYWSIAQSKEKRETVASGQGWELFENYLIAKEKFKPDYFLYENNKSASLAIKNQIANELKVELQYINSALVSAQNRQRFYAHNIPNVPEPEDRHILLKDIIKIEGIECAGSRGRISENLGKRAQKLEIRAGNKTNALTTVQKDNLLIYPFGANNENKAYCLDANYYKGSTPSQTLNKHRRTLVVETTTTTEKVNNINILQVKNGKVLYKENYFSISLPDGIYKIRKLTPIECERLQTLPDNYTEGVSNTQRYKCLGNGWTAEVIIHILSYIDYPKDAPIEVLSMYDGIATGRYCLEKLGYKNVIYKAYEIDKYAIKIATKNYPDIIECGDAFQVREEDWKY